MDELMSCGAKTDRRLHTGFGLRGSCSLPFFLLHFETATALLQMVHGLGVSVSFLSSPPFRLAMI